MQELPTNGELKLMLDGFKESLKRIELDTKDRHTENKDTLKEIMGSVKETVVLGNKTNGRVTALEEWTRDAQKVIESTTTIATNTLSSYKADKVRMWTAITLMIFFGGTIITLAIMAIDSKIQKGYSSPEAKRIIKEAVVESLEENSEVIQNE